MAHQPLTLMAVHAHPDDEASSTGGVLARASAEGITTVVVTCTDGALGDDSGGAKPNADGYERARVVATRRGELERSCAILGVSSLERLEYRDSGMMGWPENDAEGSFWSLDVAEAVQPLIALFELYRPQVVVTYDANGFYGHPDHIQAHRITMAAAEATGIPDKIYFPTFPRSIVPKFTAALLEAGETIRERDSDPDESEQTGPPEEWGTPDELVSAWIDCSSVVATKRDALAAHASQTDSSFFMKISPERFTEMFGTEAFLREFDRTGEDVPETDLFSGLR